MRYSWKQSAVVDGASQPLVTAGHCVVSPLFPLQTGRVVPDSKAGSKVKLHVHRLSQVLPPLHTHSASVTIHHLWIISPAPECASSINCYGLLAEFPQSRKSPFMNVTVCISLMTSHTEPSLKNWEDFVKHFFKKCLHKPLLFQFGYLIVFLVFLSKVSCVSD